MAADVSAVDLGDPLPNFGTTVYDATGVLANAGAMVVTLTFPDGLGGVTTKTSPADLTVTNASTGRYTSFWLSTALGEHRARWVATGLNASAREQVWQVGAQDLILGVDAARAWLRSTKPVAEDELRAVLASIADVCEHHTRKTWRRTIVTAEEHLGVCGPVRLRKFPAAQLSSVTVNGSTVTDVFLDRRRGQVWRGSSTARIGFRGDVVVSYVAGPLDGVVPDRILLGCRLLLGHVWETQRGGSNLPRRSGAEDDINPAISLVPSRVRQAWGTPRVLVR